jgi:hypothetical protein
VKFVLSGPSIPGNLLPSPCCFGPTPTPTPTSTSTGYHSPSAQAADTGGDGNGFESNPTNVFSDNAAYAVDTNSGTNTSTTCTDAGKDKHRFYNYGFALPAGATINGLEVRLDAKVDATSNAPKLCAQVSWDGGATWTAAKTTATLSTSEVTYLLAVCRRDCRHSAWKRW